MKAATLLVAVDRGRFRIWVRGRVIVDRRYRSGAVWPRPVSVRQLDGTGLPEVLLTLFSGGNGCCFTHQIYARDKRLRAPWGVPPRIRDADGDGKPEFHTAESRWSLWGPRSMGRLPLKVWSYAAGAVTDVTRSFPREVQADQAAHYAAYEQALAADDPVGARNGIAAYVADGYTLGQGEAAMAVLQAAVDAGRLDDPTGEQPAAEFLETLQRLLRDRGYITPPAQAAAARSPACSASAATPLIQPADPNTNRRVVHAVHCGALLGPGSEAMIVVVASQGGCEGVMGWQAFRGVDGAWVPTTDGPHLEGQRAVRVEGATVIEERRVHRRTDWSACQGSGGEQARAWTWDGGTGLVAGAWRQTTPARPAREALNTEKGTVEFRVAGAPVECFMVSGVLWPGDEIGHEVSCEYRRSPRSTVNLFGFGGMRVCQRRSSCRFDETGERPWRVLRKGHYAIVGRYRCSAVGGGVRCIVIRNGKGFRLDAKGVHRLK